MEFLANILSGAAISASSNRTFWLVLDEPSCPKELL